MQYLWLGDYRSAELNLEFARLLPRKPLKNPACIGKPNPLNIFHGIGKVLYKSQSEYIHPKDIIDSLFVSVDKFNMYLLENAIPFCDLIEEYDKFSDALSLSNVIKSQVQWSVSKSNKA